MKSHVESLLIVLVAVFAPAKSALLSVVGLCVADMVFGTLAARKQGIKITSRGFKRTLVKLMVYESALLCAFLTGQYLTGEYLPVMNIVAGLIGVTELKSILENLGIIQGTPLFNSAVKAIEQQLNPKPPSDEA